MTATQKTLIVVTLVAAVGAGIYEARQASVLRAQVLSLQQQQVSPAEQIDRLSRERDEIARQLATLRDDNQRLQASVGELFRLRAEVARLRVAAQTAASAADSREASAAQSWLDRTQRLRARLEQLPQAKIPELQFATEDDWLNAAKGKLDTEEDYRRALSSLRGAVENKFIVKLQAALKKFQETGSVFPSDIKQLEPHFDPSIDPALLTRWKVVPAREISSLGMGGESIITQDAVDAEFDQRWGLGPNGYGTTSYREQPHPIEVMASLYGSLLASGQTLTDPAQLQPFATTPEQQSVLNRVVEAFKAMSPEQRTEALQQIRDGNR